MKERGGSVRWGWALVQLIEERSDAELAGVVADGGGVNG
jgi:hypothetical protein